MRAPGRVRGSVLVRRANTSKLSFSSASAPTRPHFQPAAVKCPCSFVPRFFYQPVYFYRHQTVRVHRSGINGNRYLPLEFKFQTKMVIQTVCNGLPRYKLFLPLWFELKSLRIALKPFTRKSVSGLKEMKFWHEIGTK
jgi:hypothetical protein